MDEKNWVVVESTIDETLGVHGPYTKEDARSYFWKLVEENNADIAKNDEDEDLMTVNPDEFNAVSGDFRIEIVKMTL